MECPKISTTTLLDQLTPPTGKVHMVLDTDTFNEIDDQFAVVQAILSPDSLDLKAIYAAPFHNKNSDSAGDGMEKSYGEILRLLERLNVSPEGFVFKGATQFLSSWQQPEASPATDHLIDLALKIDGVLYVVAVGAITNVASAILLEPQIIEKIVVIWLGGQPPPHRNSREFNLGQDILSSQLAFDCGVPLVQIPCQGVASHLQTTVAEIERYVEGQGDIGDYLAQIFKAYHADHFGWSKVIWDISAVAYLINPSWIETELVHSPILTDQITLSFDNNRHFMRLATYVHRDPIFRDLFRKLDSI